MLKQFELPPTVHHNAHYRVWQKRGYDMNIWSEKKRIEKINYMHRNPVKRGTVAQPGDWPCSRRGGEALLPGGEVGPGNGSDAVNTAREKLGTHT
jgi:hypothetical protein